MFPAKFSNLAPNLNKEESSNLQEFDKLGADAISGCLKHFRLFSLFIEFNFENWHSSSSSSSSLRAGLSKNAKRGFQSCGIFFNWSCFKRLSGFIFYHFALEVFSAPQKREIGRELKFGNSCVLPSRANVLDGSQGRMNFRTLISLAILFD